MIYVYNTIHIPRIKIITNTYYNTASAIQAKNTELNKVIILLRKSKNFNKPIRLTIDKTSQKIQYMYTFNNFYPINKNYNLLLRTDILSSIRRYNLLLAERVDRYKHSRSTKLLDKNKYYKRYVLHNDKCEETERSTLFNTILKCNSLFTSYILRQEDKISKTRIHPTRTLLGKMRNASVVFGQTKCM